MAIRLLTSAEDLERYNIWIKAHAHGTLWQSLEWKTYQEALGRKTRLYVDEDENEIVASALISIDTTAMKLSTWDIARGPIFDESRIKNQELRIPQVLVDQIITDAKHEGAMTVFFSPQEKLAAQSSMLQASLRHEKPEATVMIDLTKSPDELLEQMHQKGRYNIRLAEKKGVVVEQSADVYAFTQLIKKTSERDGFTPPSARTYEKFLRQLPGSFLLLAYAPGTDQPIGGLIGTIWNGTGIYYYGASDHAQRALMAPYALQWTAMQFCKQQGATQYDLFGTAPTDDPNHPWAGVTDFKKKFGGIIITYPPEQQIVLKPTAAAAIAMKRRIFG